MARAALTARCSCGVGGKATWGQVLRPSTTRGGCMQQEHAAGGTGCQDARTGLSDACSMAVSSTE